MKLIQDFYAGNLNLQQLNRANILMIPKKEGANVVGDFRPISTINLIPKIISKMLATRLAHHLPDLISIKQSAFIRGRQISENFLATREILQHISQVKSPAVFLKLDFTKAFDSLNWGFLSTIMAARGLPDKWCMWIDHLLRTSSSRVVVNGETTTYFAHKKGLRQGDPLSPLLFNLAVDVLQRLIGAANDTLKQSLSSKLREPIMALQYADDTAIIARADLTTMVSLKLILRLFSSISGLQINYSKSVFLPLNLDQSQQELVKIIFACEQTDLPITYLGMPLTFKRPRRGDFLPLIEKLEKRLEGWQSKLISRGGRLLLQNSVLASIPIYYMTCFVLPKWVIRRIDSIRRRFLWGKSKGQGKVISLMNWDLVCTPKQWGGLGASNLELRNISLILRWWWKAQTDPDCLWSSIINTLRGMQLQPDGPKVWAVKGSNFWGQLVKLQHRYYWCIKVIVGQGNAISFWYDPWNGCPLRSIKDRMPRPQLQRISLKDAWPIVQELEPQVAENSVVQFGQGDDEIEWRWTAQGSYSASSYYKVISAGGLIKWRFAFIWKTNTPPKVKVFTVLLLKKRLLTHDIMARRRMHCEARCVMCVTCSQETAHHLFFRCRYAMMVWRGISSSKGTEMLTVGNSVQQIWDKSWEKFSRGAAVERKEWAALFMCTLWNLWKQRNNKIFSDKCKPAIILVHQIIEEAQLWLKYCTGARIREGIG